LTVDSGTNVDLKSQRREVELSTETTNASHHFTSADSIPALLKQIEELQKNLKISIDENKNITEKNQQLTTEIESLQSQLQTLQDELDAALAQGKVQTKERASLEERIAQLTKELESATNTSNKQQQDLDNQIQRQRANLQTQMEEKKNYKNK